MDFRYSDYVFHFEIANRNTLFPVGTFLVDNWQTNARSYEMHRCHEDRSSRFFLPQDRREQSGQTKFSRRHWLIKPTETG